jgi:predicted RecA/RadA family phage recombinase
MAQAEFVQDGHAIDYTPNADVAAGTVVVREDLVGVTKRDIKANTLGALAVSGVFTFPKATGPGTAIAAGKKVYWDATEKVAKEDAETPSSSGGEPLEENKYLGKTVQAAGDNDATVSVRLSQ